MRDCLVYLTGPITPKNGYTIEENAVSALRVYLECLRRGIPAFCPQLSAVFPSAFDVDYETWMAYDFAVIDRCTHMLCLPRWEESSGALREVAYARGKGMPVAMTLDALEAEL